MARLGWRVTQWNDEALLRKVDAAVRSYAETLSPQFDRQIAAVKWGGWPVPTRRRSGETAGATRNIVDLGNLLRSKKLYTPEPGTRVFLWDPVNPESGERYGYTVLSGVGYVNRQGAAIQRPGRDWITPVVRSNPFGPGFASAWRRLPEVR